MIFFCLKRKSYVFTTQIYHNILWTAFRSVYQKLVVIILFFTNTLGYSAKTGFQVKFIRKKVNILLFYFIYWFVTFSLFQMRYWLRLLDSHLPPPFCQVGEWLARADDFIESDEIPTVMNEETATIISRKLEEHKVDHLLKLVFLTSRKF